MHETLLNKYMEVVHSVYGELYEHEKEMMQVTGVTRVMKKKSSVRGSKSEASVAGACGVVPKSGDIHMDIRNFLLECGGLPNRMGGFLLEWGGLPIRMGGGFLLEWGASY